MMALVPPAVVTVTSPVPAVPAGVVAVIEVLDPTAKLVAATPPNFTPVAPLKALPVMVTVWPPATGPELGETLLTVGAGARYVNRSFTDVALVPAAVVTVTSTLPGVPAGEVAVMEPSPFTVNESAGDVPKLTLVAPVKPAPLMVTVVAPLVPPLFGEMPVTCGPKVNWSAVSVLLVPPGPVTVMSTRVPAVPGGETAVIDPFEFTVKLAAGVVPNETPVDPLRP